MFSSTCTPPSYRGRSTCRRKFKCICTNSFSWHTLPWKVHPGVEIKNTWECNHLFNFTLFSLAMAEKQFELSRYELNRKPQELILDATEIKVQRKALNALLMCPICLDILRGTMTTKECLHRFCQECITTALRSGNKECPTCRKVRFIWWNYLFWLNLFCNFMLEQTQVN